MRLFYTMGILCYTIIGVLFIFFFYTGYESAAAAKFLSMDSSSGTCEYVGTQIDAVQFASSDGAWEGFRRFKYNQAKFLFTFSGNLHIFKKCSYI